VVVISVICHGRAVPLLWKALDHPSASVSAEVVIELLERADRLLADFGSITLLADRAFPSAELLSWFYGKARWRYVMRLRADTWIHGTAAPKGCEVRRLRLPRGYCRGFRDVRLWGDGSQRANLLLVVAIAVLVSSLQGFAVSLSGQRRLIDPHWQRGLSFVRIGLKWLQQQVINGHQTLLACQPIPLRVC
jgi:hypothetical protein